VGSFSSCERAVLGANAHISRLYEIFVEPAYRIGRRFAATGRFDVSSIILLPGLTVPQALPYQALRQQALRQDRANAPVGTVPAALPMLSVTFLDAHQQWRAGRRHAAQICQGCPR
jgi:hypothetical protein